MSHQSSYQLLQAAQAVIDRQTELIDRLLANTGVSAAPADPLAATMPAVPIPDLLRIMAGQQLPNPDGQWAMSNNALFFAVLALGNRTLAAEQSLASLQVVSAAQQALLAAFAAGLDRQSAQIQVLNANLLLAQQASQALQLQLAADGVRLAAVEAQAMLTASATEANRLEIAKNTAADALRDARLTTDEAAIAAAQATATQAKADAATAQKLAADDAAAVLVAQGQAKAAQDAAKAAQDAVTSLANRFRAGTAAVAALSGALNATLDVVVTFPAFADTAFVIIAEPAGLTLLGLDATEITTARTASSATFRIKNALGLAIAAGGTLTFFAYRP